MALSFARSSSPFAGLALASAAATKADLPGILDIYNDAVLHTTATADYEVQTLTASKRIRKTFLPPSVVPPRFVSDASLAGTSFLEAARSRTRKLLELPIRNSNNRHGWLW